MQEKRNISAHNLPMAFQAFPGRPVQDRPAAAFLAQLLNNRDYVMPIGPCADARDREASTTYRRVEASDIKRLPLGFRKSLSA